MKRSIILLMALIVLCAMPILASTPEQDMVLIVDEGDGDFSGLEQVSDEQLANVEGNIFHSAADGASPITKRDMQEIFDRNSERVSIDFDFDLNPVFGVSYTEKTNGSYTIAFTTIGITQQIVISEDDFQLIQIYAASHHLPIIAVIVMYFN